MSFASSKQLLDQLSIEQIKELYEKVVGEIMGKAKLTKEQLEIIASHEDFLQDVEDGLVKRVTAERAAKMVSDLITIISEISDYEE